MTKKAAIEPSATEAAEQASADAATRRDLFAQAQLALRRLADFVEQADAGRASKADLEAEVERSMEEVQTSISAILAAMPEDEVPPEAYA
jgi:hypothetical protein